MDHSKHIAAAVAPSTLTSCTLIQPLWADYGGLYRVELNELGCHSSLIAKVIHNSVLTAKEANDVGHLRKCRSYQIECHWYQHTQSNYPNSVAMAKLIDLIKVDDITILLMEDLGCNAYAPVDFEPTLSQLNGMLDWLAQFHSVGFKVPKEGLWPQGSYWHLDTRLQEWHRMPESPLKAGAHSIDQTLKQAEFQTLIHGDAKVANFLCDPNDNAAAVDFQYVGSGVGVQDVVYLIGSALDNDQLQRHYSTLIDYYFSQLAQHLGNTLSGMDASAIEAQWRQLLPLCWADFERFLTGWKPGHWKLNAFSAEQTQIALRQLTLS